MKVIVTTSHGTKYYLDPEGMTWRRESERPLRWTDRDEGPTSGDLYIFPEIVIGESMYIVIREPDGFTPIVTTAVTNFENVED